jgi:S1-C subfamily serine protease
LTFISTKVNAQVNLNGIKYIIIPKQISLSEKKEFDIIISTLSENFKQKGFQILKEDESLPNELNENSCLAVNLEIEKSGNSKVSISLRDCTGNYMTPKITSSGYDYEKATQNVFKDLKLYEYKFDSQLTPGSVKVLPKIKKENKESLKEYYSLGNIKPIEGIFKSIDKLTPYTIGIKKVNDLYIAYNLESSLSNWKEGDIKAYFEPTALKSMYAIKWYMGDKKNIEEIFGYLESDVLINFELIADNFGSKRQVKFLKIFPINEEEKGESESNVKSTGSGFFVSTNGLIATNAHVVENSKKISVTVKNELGSKTFKAKLELKDSKNDVAIIKIDDSEFKELKTLPYLLVEKADVGEKSFTIGFPLNDVMGSNFKITDGIISSSTGINDDLRYYQISVPLQPGNSGGPLFNKNGNIIGITTSKLNSKAVGTNVENVNYAIKIQYLNNILNMLPSYSPLIIQNNLNGKELQEQVKQLKNYVCIIEVE